MMTTLGYPFLALHYSQGHGFLLIYVQCHTASGSAFPGVSVCFGDREKWDTANFLGSYCVVLRETMVAFWSDDIQEITPFQL